MKLPAGRAIPGTIVPEDRRRPLFEQGLDEIRDCVRWVRENEPTIRQYIADEMFEGWLNGWYDEEIDTITTKDEFHAAISLSGINILENCRASLCYNDANL
ncbi:MAG TPA: hypothetical protein VN688_19065, partial [Gemmataceae bacterium]|nr:hypothetical protein [Gemmataceae bacterium]